jgi:hypothetical protein
MYIKGICCLIAWLVGDNFLFRDFGPYGIIFVTVFTTLHFPIILDGQFPSFIGYVTVYFELHMYKQAMGNYTLTICKYFHYQKIVRHNFKIICHCLVYNV